MLNFFKKKTEWKGNEIYSVVDGRLKKLEKIRPGICTENAG